MTHRIVHFAGFKDDRYWSAVKAFGQPNYIHRGWDLRAKRELDETDLVVFADNPHDQEPRVRSYDDLREQE